VPLDPQEDQDCVSELSVRMSFAIDPQLQHRTRSSESEPAAGDVDTSDAYDSNDDQIADKVPSGLECDPLMVLNTSAASAPRPCSGGSLDGRPKRTGHQ
jgi:hypothetical protein